MQIRLNSVKFDYQVLVFLDTTLREDKELACLYVSSIVRNRHSVFICVGVVSSSSTFVSSNQPNEKILLPGYMTKRHNVCYSRGPRAQLFLKLTLARSMCLWIVYTHLKMLTRTRVSRKCCFSCRLPSQLTREHPVPARHQAERARRGHHNCNRRNRRRRHRLRRCADSLRQR